MRRAICALVAMAVLSACGEGAVEERMPAAEAKAEIPADEVGVKFREGKGLEVADATKEILKISLAEVSEGELSQTLSRTGHVYGYEQEPDVSVSDRAKVPAGLISLVIPADEAKGVKVESPVTVGEDGMPGRVTEVRQLSMGRASEAELLIQFTDPQKRYAVGNPVSVTIQGEASHAPAIIPRESLIETVNGTFVYVPNGRYYFRTAVQVGRKTKESVEILDGLYPGDQVVRSPVVTLWLAELQAIRGGVACADGH